MWPVEMGHASPGTPAGVLGTLSGILMSVIFLLIGASTLVAVVFLTAFLWAVRSGQYEDDRSPAVRILGDRGASNERRTDPKNS